MNTSTDARLLSRRGQQARNGFGDDVTDSSAVEQVMGAARIYRDHDVLFVEIGTPESARKAAFQRDSWLKCRTHGKNFRSRHVCFLY